MGKRRYLVEVRVPVWRLEQWRDEMLADPDLDQEEVRSMSPAEIVEAMFMEDGASFCDGR